MSCVDDILDGCQCLRHVTSNICLSAFCWLIGLVFRAVCFLYRSPKTHVNGRYKQSHIHVHASRILWPWLPTGSSNHDPICSLHKLHTEWSGQKAWDVAAVFSLFFCLATLTDINNNLYVCEHVWREPLKIYPFSRNELALGWVSQTGQGNQKVLRLLVSICSLDLLTARKILNISSLVLQVLCFCLPSVYLPIIIWGQLCLWARASVFLSEGCWFNSPGLHVKVPLGKILNPQNCSCCAGRHLARQPPPSAYKCMYESL